MRVALLLLGLLACGPVDPTGNGDQMPGAGTLDRDGDGLCDWREEALGTDPLATDTDNDGLPDLVEYLHDFAALDAESPSSQQLIELQSGDTDATSIEVRFTVTGNGESYRGAFIPLPSALTTGYDGTELYVQATALGAQPVDNIRDIQETAQRFVTVTGPTRLTFRVTLGSATLPIDSCHLALPFAYGLYDNAGRELMRSTYVAVIKSRESDADFCLAAECI